MLLQTVNDLYGVNTTPNVQKVSPRLHTSEGHDTHRDHKKHRRHTRDIQRQKNFHESSSYQSFKHSKRSTIQNITTDNATKQISILSSIPEENTISTLPTTLFSSSMNENTAPLTFVAKCQCKSN